MGTHYLNMGNKEYLPITGKIFEFEGEQFLAHRTIGVGYDKNGRYMGRKGKYYILYPGYDITHLRTGVNAYHQSEKDTRKNTIEGFPKNISRKLKYFNISLKDLIKEIVGEHGLTPEFDKTKEELILKDKIVR